MNDAHQLSLWPEGDSGHGQDDCFPPGPNYLAQFRKPMTEEDWAEATRDFEQAITDWLNEWSTVVPARDGT